MSKMDKEILIFVRDVILAIIIIGIWVLSLWILANPSIVGWLGATAVYLVWMIAIPIIWVACIIWNKGDD